MLDGCLTGCCLESGCPSCLLFVARELEYDCVYKVDNDTNISGDTNLIT
jgi:hypothetical protein